MSNLMLHSNLTAGGIDLKTPNYREPDIATIGSIPQKVNVVCVQSGEKYKPDYVEKLRNAVHRNLSVEHTFIVLRDTDISEADVWGGWWSKVNLFNPDYIPEGLTLYLDLDVVLTGSIDDVVACETTHPLTIIKNFSINIRHCAYNSSAMLWWSGDPKITRIYEEFKKDPDKIRNTLHGDQCWVWRVMKDDAAVFPEHLIRSYKYHCRGIGLPLDSRVVVFHGKPDPHEVNDSWVKENWK